jgi:hypothetical protein
VVPIDGGSAPAVVPGSFADQQVCGWRAGGGELWLRSSSPPVQIRRVSVATGVSATALEIDPPRVGRRGVYSVVVSEEGAYAYSFSQELSRLYALTTGPV